MKKSFLRMMILALAGGVSAFAAAQYALLFFQSKRQSDAHPEPACSFPRPSVGATSTATVVIVNQGDAPGTVTAVAGTGASFQISGLPTLPKTLQPNDNIAFYRQLCADFHGLGYRKRHHHCGRCADHHPS